ncbi:MFS transporter [Effusibacillus dendaii]|uniref:NIPSNAP domain-containing protein n=1 Tax=Effusibacillus dendaii TaxID=2743772 RepID=A0A7I8DEB8_9BACL|nr:MFS transporter [Effusibacillus dendaii]BCJ88387.1 hypothetical protein skT53_33720 [Effusibacillus dendaii]
MSIKVFVEYKVKPERREEYLNSLPQLRQKLESSGALNVRFFAGTDQPLLYVEEFFVSGMEQYETMKQARISQADDFWVEQSKHVEGGLQKIHIWAFSEIETENRK